MSSANSAANSFFYDELLQRRQIAGWAEPYLGRVPASAAPTRRPEKDVAQFSIYTGGYLMNDLAELGVVIIARNEERHIEACLSAVMEAVRPFPGTPVILVDSDSSDDTVKIAKPFPVTVYRYRAARLTAAAGRRIGFERVHARYVLFADGDCRIEANWLRLAVSLMQNAPQAAVVYGARREVFEGVAQEFKSAGPAPEDYDLGGNALYRADVLKMVGGFNPFIVAEEEGELLARIQAAGYGAVRTREVMITHHTLPKDSMREFWRRYRRASRGRGQVLRLAIRQGLLPYHARRFNRYLLTLAYLTIGAILGATGAMFMAPILPILWICLGVLAFVGLCIRRRSLRSAVLITADWTLTGTTILWDFLRPPVEPASFSAVVERLN